MLYGIDISNWQNGLQLSTSAADMYIMKATEGISYIDKCCDNWVQWCIDNGKPWGFYHFMRERRQAGRRCGCRAGPSEYRCSSGKP